MLVKNRYKNMHEPELLNLYKQGDTEAWGELALRYRGSLTGICQKFGIQKSIAQELAQDALVRAYENRERFDEKKKFSTWIFIIAENICKNYIRKESARSFHEGIYLKNIYDCQKDPASHVEERIKLDVKKAVLDAAISSLEPKYIEPLRERYRECRTAKEISELLNIPEGTVKTRLYDARKKLRKKLIENGINDRGDITLQLALMLENLNN